MVKKAERMSSFAEQAERILALPVAHRVNALGGYGPGGEVIYESHPSGCPSVLVDSQDAAKVTFMSNGSVDFLLKLADGIEVHVLDGSFDPVEKREIGVPSGNVWVGLGVGGRRRVASLINPNANIGLAAERIRIVKLGDPRRAMWYCAFFKPGRAVAFATAVRYALVTTKAGPALVREIYLKNTGTKALAADLWTCFHLHGTQRFVYNKELWYDSGLPVTPGETVVAATVPYSDIVQIKRVSGAARGARPTDATCDYATFVGDTAASAFLPEAVRRGRMLPGGAARRLNRFTTAAVAAGKFVASVPRGRSATVQQSLLYVTDERLVQRFRRTSGTDTPAYEAISKSFLAAARELIERTPAAADVCRQLAASGKARAAPFFELNLPAQRAVSEYANSVWTGVAELYENCRAHGAKLAGGIELGTRDRAQDMWPKMKEDPGRVRADLIHALSFMYVTCEAPPAGGKPLTLPQKLHGMFPRQYPSRWDDRTQELANDNRPYADSPLWLVNALDMYIRETGDAGILLEKVRTVRLTNPQQPEVSGIVGHDAEHTILEVLFEIFACFERHVNDSPYGMAQVLYGDWCDPVDMFGTSAVGDAATRGKGRGVQVRLSAHLFECLVAVVDLCRVRPIAEMVARFDLGGRVAALGRLAESIRRNVVKFAWEAGARGFPAGFIDFIHELNKDGSRPDYAAGQIGYTLGSMKGRDFDGIRRRQLEAQAYGLQMLLTERDYLTPVDGAREMIAKLLETTDNLFFDEKLGLVMFSVPIANSARSRRMVGRMGVVPVGCAENGEYHHCQVFMHRFRLSAPGQADTVWRQFKPIMSAMRDESLAGPFETPCTSYASDKKDPHFGKGMYFGLSGSTDWIVEIFQKIAGLELALHDDAKPSVRVRPNLPSEIDETLTFRRTIHCALPGGGYRRIPFSLDIRRRGEGRKRKGTLIKVNGKRAEKAEVWDLAGCRRVRIEITGVYGG